MRHLTVLTILVLLVPFLSISCSKPTDIVFGPEPVKQMAEQGDQFKKLPEEDRVLLAAYLTIGEVGKIFGGEVKPVTGRTVGEVLVDARVWRGKMNQVEADAKKRNEENEALKAKIIAERKAIANKIASSVVVAVTDKKVLPKNYDAGRYTELLVISYALENKSDRTILQIKGRVHFYDATGDEVGSLPVDFDERIRVGKTLKTTTGSGWKLNEFMRGNIEKIAERDFGSMKTNFEAEAIAFDDGEVLKAPELNK